MADITGFASRLYRGEANLNIVGKRQKWFAVAGGITLVAIIALFVFGFKGGIEFTGGNEFTIPASVSPSITEVQEAVAAEVHKFQPDARINPGQQIGDGAEAVYSIQTPALTADESNAVKQAIAAKYNIDAQGDISDSQISARWGESVTQQALWALVIFLAAVTAYLSVRFEWRMAVAAVVSLLFNLLVTAGIYSVVGFEVTPNTVIGFLTILGFALYDVVVVFDKVQENTRGITGSSTQTYAEATNLALNQTFMRSINTSLVALLPVGGLLFIGAGLLGAGTLKDLGLVLFIGMGMAVFSSLFFASPVLVWLKEMDPVIQNHTKRVLARRTQLAKAAAEGPVSEKKVVAAAAAPAAPVAPKAGAKPVRPARQGNTGRQGTGKRR
ncbi:protein translocase subunit SecF [Catelliglobosispora koreensis]|uniref:protein translocase subunit SecF n=1 Tax=Catelliglobosispora koreensis TaxID=129052 RepID=UPI00035EF3ED|nr:protein translocase subunit SecF [Catelliglobosispora koreensis]